MTKKARKTGKRSLAVFMSILMLMSAWVFVAPTASANTTGLTLWEYNGLNGYSSNASTGVASGRYYINTNTTIKAKNNTEYNGGIINTNQTVLVYIPDGVTLTCEGGAGSGTNKGQGGLYLRDGATLIITGPGKLVAKGGKGGDGTDGGQGKAGSEGGWGGYGGAGGGAGIGGDGGDGGNRGNAGDNGSGRSWNGGNGGGGGNGVSGRTIYILDSITSSNLTKTNGGNGNAGSGGGVEDSGDWDNGGGGGGGGKGKGGHAIGSGGPGGGGGGGGGAGSGWAAGKKQGHGGGGGSEGGTNGAEAQGHHWSKYSAGSGGASGSYADESGNHIQDKTAFTAPDYAKGLVTFDKNGGSGGTDSAYQTIGYPMQTKDTKASGYPNITLPTRDGYDFDGYWTAASGGTKYINADGSSAHVYDYYELDLYAHWTEKDQTVTLNKQSGTGGTSTVYYTYNTNKYYSNSNHSTQITSVTLPTRTGYTFGGYYTETEGAGTQYITAAGAFTNNLYKQYGTNSEQTTRTLYAKWTINTSTLTVQPNTGTWSGHTTDQSYTQNYNTTKTISNPTAPDGKHFTGWTLGGDQNGSFSGTTYTFGAGNNKTDTLTAGYAVHTWDSGTITTQPTCTTAGVKTFHCTYTGCTATKTEAVGALGHEFTGAVHNVEPGRHNWKCSRCSAYGTSDGVNTTVACSGGTANCVDQAICSVCNTAYGVVDPANHKSTENRAAVANSCETGGYTAGVYCTACNQWVSGHEPVAAKGHDYTGAVHSLNNGTHNWACKNNCGTYGKVENGTQVKDGTVGCRFGDWTADTATCLEGGSQSRTCEDCGYVETKTTSQLGHNWVETTEVTFDVNHLKTAATCEEDAVYYKSCSRCGVNSEETFVALNTKTGHDYTGTARDNGDGTHSWLCQNGCGTYGKVDNGTQVKDGKVAHTYGDWYDVTDANCKEEGSQTHKCSVCNKVETLPIPTNDNHDWDEGEITTPANCHDLGVKTFTCARCGSVKTEDVAIDPSNHKHLVRTAPVSNGCETDGNIEYWFCDGCGKYYSDAAATQQITQADTVIPAKGHDFSDTVRDNGDGTHSWLCKNGCGNYGAVISGTQVKDGSVSCEATYSTWSEDTADCVNGGTQSRTCSVCSHEETRNTNPLGHLFTKQTVSDATLYQAATCNSKAKYWYSCDRCGEIELDNDHTFESGEFDPNNHNFVFNRTVAPLCEADGYDLYICSRCQAEDQRNPVGQLGHLWGAWTSISNTQHKRTCERDANHTETEDHDMQKTSTVAPTCTEGGYDVFTCSVCGYSENRNPVAALGHDFTGAVRDNNNGSHSYKCTHENCNEYGVGTGASAEVNGSVSCEDTYSDWGGNTATCNEGGIETRTCSVCGHVDERQTQPLGHDLTDEVISEQTLYKDATCTEPAVYFYTCSRCGYIADSVTNTFTHGDPLGHDWQTPTYVWHNNNTAMVATTVCSRDRTHEITEDATVTRSVTKEPTCTEKGIATYTATFQNPYNAEYDYTTTFATQTTTSDVNTIPHKTTTHVDAVAPTCTEPGNIEYWICEVCGGYFTDVGGYYLTTAEDVVLAIVPDAHDYGPWTPNGEEGHTKVCSYNEEHNLSEDHKWANIVSEQTKATNDGPICENGEAYYKTCSECGYISKTEIFTTQASGHKLVYVPAVAPTCTEAGTIVHYQCGACGKYFSDAAAENEITDISVPATDHNFTGAYKDNGDGTHSRLCVNGCGTYGATADHAWTEQNAGANYAVDGQAADCTSEGHYYYSCVCGACENNAEHTFTAGGSLGHVLHEIEAVAATCKADGHDAYWYCSRCGKYFTDSTAGTETTPAAHIVNHSTVAHTWGDWTEKTAPTCTTIGKDERTCSVCGLVETRDVPVIAHDYTGDVVTYNNGTHAHKCKYGCGMVGPIESCTRTIKSTTAADCVHLGTTTYKCDVCGYEWTEEQTGVGPHSSTPTHHDAVPATCTTAGTIEYWTCELCGKNFSDAACTSEATNLTVPALNHEGIFAVAQQDANCTTDGVKAHFKCPICNKLFSDATAAHEVNAEDLKIPQLGHNFYGEMKDNEDGTHSFKCTRCDVYGNPTTHTFDRKVVNNNTLVSAADCLNPAKYHYSCACGAIDTEGTAGTFDNGQPTGHAYNSVKADSWVWTKSGETYTVTATVVCANNAGHEETRNAVVTFTTTAPNCEAAGIRHYTATITLDNGTTATDTKDEEVAKVGHSMVETAAVRETCETAGNSKYYTCSVCHKYFSDANGEHEIAANSWVIPAKGHDFDYANATYVWNDTLTEVVATAICKNDPSHKEVAKSTEVTSAEKTPATCTVMGTTTYTAAFDAPFANQTKDVQDIPTVAHTLSKTEAKAATCQATGNIEYWTCSVCNQKFSDENGDHAITEVETPIDPDNHVTLTHHAAVDATCTTAGSIEHWVCNDCHKKLVYNDAGKLVEVTDVVIPAGPAHHRFTTHVSAKDATCTQQGNVEYWTCSVCRKHFDGNTESANELTNVSTAPLGHDVTKTAAKAATCTEDGNLEYWYCARCHQYFLADSITAEPVAFSATVDPKKGHTEQTVDAIPATCEAGGNKKVVYCSVCDTILKIDDVVVEGNNWKYSVDTDKYELDARGHAYGAPEWNWATDYSSATATFTCANDDTHVVTENATITTEVTSHTDGAKTVYTATVTFNGETYTDVKTVLADNNGHTLESVTAKEATCDAAGNRAYWKCTDAGCGKLFLDEHAKVETTLAEVTIAALGHKWVNPTWSWTPNGTEYSAATLTYTCANDETHTYVIDAIVTSETISDASCLNDGKVRYTATATVEAKDNLPAQSVTDTKEVTLEKTGHTLTPTAAKNATCLADGNIAYWTCSVCNKIFSDENARYEITAADTVIAALGHTYDYAHADYDWSADHSSCTATATCIRCDATDTETKASTNNVKIPATCEAQGIRIYTVDFDNENFATQTYDELIPANGHGTAAMHEGKAATCEAAGFEAYWTCSVCGKLFKAETLTAENEIANPIVIPAKGHDWNYETVVYTWSETEPYTCTATVTCKNDGNHTKDVTGSVTITASTEADCTTDGSRTYTATFPADTKIPTDTKTATTPALGHDFSESIDRAHVVDGTHHNYKCVRCNAYGIGTGESAEVNGSVACTFHGDWLVSENETCTEPGSEWRKCGFCSNKETREREALSHQVFSVDAKDATCVAIGNKAYTYCERCGLLLTVDGVSVEEQNIKFNAPEAIALYKTEDMLNHDLTATAAKAATCEEDGNIAYWTCERCGKIFNTATPTSNEAAITLVDTVLPATKHDFTGAVRDNDDNTHSKKCTKCDAYGIMVNGTPVKDGKEACYGGTATCTDAAICSVCGHAYQAKLGHNYVLQSWTWNGYTAATAHYVCTNNTTHTKDVEATVNKTDATVTCTAAGQNTYVATATFTDGDKTYTDTDTKTEVVNATGHNWDFEHPVYSWDANQNCTVTLKCLNDEDHVYTEIGKNTTETTPATCEGTGSVKYTATFTINSTLTRTHTETLAALGHKWGDPAWTWTGNDTDGYTATVKLVCDRVASHEATPDVTVTKETVAPTCEKDGRIVYTATATLDGRTYKDTKITIQPAKGHDWQAPVFTWTQAENGGYSAATALIACNNDPAHNQTLNCALTTETDNATCTEGGIVTYTATVTFNGRTYTETKTAEVTALGHKYEFVDFTWTGNDNDGYTAAVANFKCANDPTHTTTAAATVTTEKVDAICEADGKTTYTATVSFEGKDYTDEKVVVIPMLHHNWGTATYTWVKDGDQYKVTALRVCANNPEEHQQTVTVTTTSEITASSGCESEGTIVYTATFEAPFETKTREETVGVAGHTLVHVERKEPACEAAGNIEYWECSVCHKKFDNDTGTGLTLDETAIAIPALGHNFVMAKGVAVLKANEDGLTHSFKCSRCDAYGAVINGEHKTEAEGGKMTHSYGAAIVTQKPTCTVPGEQQETCTLCGYVHTAEIEMTSHVLFKIDAKSPTCTKEGNKTYYYCSVCGKFFSDKDGKNETDKAAMTIPALGHKYTGDFHDNGDGTHSRACVNGCGTYGEKSAHTYTQDHSAKNLRSHATCTEPASYYESCSICGAKSSTTFTNGTALGHKMIAFTGQDASCTQDGHTAYTECERCHLREGYNVLKSTGHGSYKYNTEKSGSTADGSLKWSCYVCENGCGDYYMTLTVTSIDAQGTRVPNVNVSIYNADRSVNIQGTTDGNGDFVVPNEIRNRLKTGTYTVALQYVKDGSNYNTSGTIKIANGTITGSYGKLTPYGGNASGSIGGEPTGEFRCSMCSTYESAKNVPVYGWFISIIHFFVHMISRIGK